MNEFFNLIRESCSSVIWSRGVELARGEAVAGERVTDTEAVLRVATPGRAASYTVKLWIEDEDWFCDCESKLNPCEHVAASVIVLKRAKERGTPLTVIASNRAIVRYHFTRSAGQLAFARRLRVGEVEQPLGSSLAAILSGRSPGPAINASKEDLGIDSLLGAKFEGVFSASTLVPLFGFLRQSEEVYLDDKKVSVGSPTSGLRARVADAEGGVLVAIERSPDVEESFANGVILIGGALRPIKTPDYSPFEKELAARGKIFRPAELAELTTSVVPELREKMAVEITTSRLPKVGEDSRPRLVFQTESRGDVLTVLPLVVYGEPPYARVDGGRLVLLGDGSQVPDRNKLAEARLASELQSELGLGIGRRLEFRGDAAARFATRLKEKPRQVIGAGIERFETRAPLTAELVFENDRPSVRFSMPEGGGADPARVFEAWRQGMSRVPLLDGSGWAPLPMDWLDRYGSRILDLMQARESSGEVAKVMRPELARLCEELNTPCPPEFKRLRSALETFVGLPSAKLPSDLNATLRPYQTRGVDWLAFLQTQSLGALLADDMGLGKTLQTLAVLSGRALIVAPTSVLPNWKKEIERFRPSLRVGVYHGSDRKLHPLADVTLTTYAILRLDIDSLSSLDWDAVVLDEAQNIKNPESQVAQAAFRLRGTFRVALSGTPVENRLEDLWSLFHFLNRGLLGGLQAFRERYVGANAREASELRTKIRPFLLRRMKKEVAPELPPRTDLVVYCELDANERRTYEAVLAATRKEVLEELGHGDGILKALECLLRLRQASCHLGLLPGNADAAPTSDSSKVRLLIEQLEEAVSEGHKALVFSQWTSLLDRIEPGLDDAKIPYCRIDGSTSDRAAVVDRFQSTDGPPVLLMTLKAGGTGLNLTAADHVFLMDPWWNPAAEDQAADRAHRIGQDRPVFVHRLVARDTVEEKILALQEVKRAAAEAALAGSGSAATLSREDLLGLLS